MGSSSLPSYSENVLSLTAVELWNSLPPPFVCIPPPEKDQYEAPYVLPPIDLQGQIFVYTLTLLSQVLETIANNVESVDAATVALHSFQFSAPESIVAVNSTGELLRTTEAFYSVQPVNWTSFYYTLLSASPLLRTEEKGFRGGLQPTSTASMLLVSVLFFSVLAVLTAVGFLAVVVTSLVAFCRRNSGGSRSTPAPSKRSKSSQKHRPSSKGKSRELLEVLYAKDKREDDKIKESEIQRSTSVCNSPSTEKGPVTDYTSDLLRPVSVRAPAEEASFTAARAILGVWQSSQRDRKEKRYRAVTVDSLSHREQAELPCAKGIEKWKRERRQCQKATCILVFLLGTVTACLSLLLLCLEVYVNAPLLTYGNVILRSSLILIGYNKGMKLCYELNPAANATSLSEKRQFILCSQLSEAGEGLRLQELASVIGGEGIARWPPTANGGVDFLFGDIYLSLLGNSAAMPSTAFSFDVKPSRPSPVSLIPVMNPMSLPLYYNTTIDNCIMSTETVNTLILGKFNDAYLDFSTFFLCAALCVLGSYLLKENVLEPSYANATHLQTERRRILRYFDSVAKGISFSVKDENSLQHLSPLWQSNKAANTVSEGGVVDSAHRLQSQTGVCKQPVLTVSQWVAVLAFLVLILGIGLTESFRAFFFLLFHDMGSLCPGFGASMLFDDFGAMNSSGSTSSDASLEPYFSSISQAAHEVNDAIFCGLSFVSNFEIFGFGSLAYLSTPAALRTLLSLQGALRLGSYIRHICTLPVFACASIALYSFLIFWRKWYVTMRGECTSLLKCCSEASSIILSKASELEQRIADECQAVVWYPPELRQTGDPAECTWLQNTRNEGLLYANSGGHEVKQRSKTGEQSSSKEGGGDEASASGLDLELERIHELARHLFDSSHSLRILSPALTSAYILAGRLISCLLLLPLLFIAVAFSLVLIHSNNLLKESYNNVEILLTYFEEYPFRLIAWALLIIYIAVVCFYPLFSAAILPAKISKTARQLSHLTSTLKTNARALDSFAEAAGPKASQQANLPSKSSPLQMDAKRACKAIQCWITGLEELSSTLALLGESRASLFGSVSISSGLLFSLLHTLVLFGLFLSAKFAIPTRRLQLFSF